MFLLAAAGGGGEAYDLCFFFPAFFGAVAAGLVAFIGLVRGEASASVLAVVMSAVIGAFVLLAAAANQPTDDPDEQASQQMLRSLLWCWGTAAVISVASAVVVAIRRCAAQRGTNAPDAEANAASDRGRM